MPRSSLSKTRRVVVKIGSQLIDESPAGRPASVADQVAAQRQHQRDVVVVSSGAIALGGRRLGHERRPSALAELQAAAAVGQNRLMAHWEHAFAAHSIEIGQVLLTHDDLRDRRRFLNARFALRALLSAGVVPVINENDTVATEEIRYGDNDLLAALVCNLVGADALIILTDVDGLLDVPPDLGGSRISVVRDADSESASEAAKASRDDGVGSGGMRSKVSAARSAARHGVCTVVANGRDPTVLASILRGDDVGTVFLPSAQRISSRKHWIAYGAKPSASISVDSGAERALRAEGRSLLAAGIVAVHGKFEMGDIVSLVTEDGTEFARGLAAYSATDVARIAGLRSSDIEGSLGYKYVGEVIHRDDLALL